MIFDLYDDQFVSLTVARMAYQIQYPCIKELAASIPSAARTFAPGGSRPVTGSSMMEEIQRSLLKVTCDSMLNPPQTFSRKNGLNSGSVDQDSKA